ncbi:MAG: metal ABC transporter substrate-binding protein [Hyphomicrobiaceae bacterium]|jgi:zinc/manganese transport system substrate-binding protein|nr:metal ABC transporter substrate-binding protein [Methyloceanibacter sp.]MDX2318686.1 metal ABC transporter substrate-binding protein [Hyphomicrobiaceae bacterium]MDX2450722.1 metal ABC transporter substrate-binding protein [Hyphomicrobiaceae bacterium]
MRRHLTYSLALSLAVLFGLSGAASADNKLKAVASFSVLGDMVKQVGGDRVEVTTLVGPNGDAHVFNPTPAIAKLLASADIFFVNGLGFEGWMERLEKSSGFKGEVVVASKGVTPLTMGEEDGHHHDDHGDDHDEGGDEVPDPHAWQSLANGKIYVANIRDGLITADPAGKAEYVANATKYLAAIDAEEAAVKVAIAKLPPERRRIITSHDAFGYLADAYGLEVISPEGVSTESEASAQDVAMIIRQIREEQIPAVFLENVTDRRLLDQIARETGAKIGGVLYSDALSKADGPAPTYLGMFRHNIGALSAALSS